MPATQPPAGAPGTVPPGGMPGMPPGGMPGMPGMPPGGMPGMSGMVPGGLMSGGIRWLAGMAVSQSHSNFDAVIAGYLCALLFFCLLAGGGWTNLWRVLAAWFIAVGMSLAYLYVCRVNKRKARAAREEVIRKYSSGTPGSASGLD
eukprot:TRINITY_DN29974_c0_g1_i1.p1 TRINITY_DN29974_c0_g1~~TRINITY_DN29974_c0_g1_i1.p1  ORF type:complete len:161 (+),score=30.17 TRINITY_DN29974_c0_g1_i1:48-485(+)